MSYTLPTDANSINFFGRKTSDNNNAFMPVVIYGADGVTPISTTNRLPVDASLTGSKVDILWSANVSGLINNVQTFYGQNGTEQTTYNVANTQDTSKYKELAFLVFNKYDQAIQVKALGDYGDFFDIFPIESLAAGSRKLYASDTYPKLKTPIPMITIQTSQGTSAPTTGNAKIYLVGVVN